MRQVPTSPGCGMDLPPSMFVSLFAGYRSTLLRFASGTRQRSGAPGFGT